jgi:hypothetical protein
MTTMTARLLYELVPEIANLDLMKELDIAPDEGVIVAFLPRTDGIMQEVEYRDGKRTFTLHSIDGKIVDLFPSDNKGVKWWMAKEAARVNKLSWPEELWRGPAAEFNLDSLPEVQQPENTVLALRMYKRGPWIRLQETKKEATE